MKPHTAYLLAGGRGWNRTDVDPVLEAILRGIGKPFPSIAYLGAANGDSPEFFQRTVVYLQKAGAGDVELAPIADAGVDLGAAKRILGRGDCVFIGGGDVAEGMRLLEERKMVPFLHELCGRGTPFLGTSAGSIMLSKCWVRWRDPDDDSTAEIFPCTALAGILCDTHGEADGWEELRALLRLVGDGQIGYGIPAGRAMGIHQDGAIEALGGGVARYLHRRGKIVRMADLLPCSCDKIS